ncbi:PEP-CTERM sorting domain-containing protein [Kamptonema cortianum]|nr:PEP-CTERM sorting domain-containing protein [Oscillatoria laete-virens]MDK3157967.1 PEP-CTERM sorting domain-containing protein [Kamptonema cortianum]MDL5046092.1 PEP-CTERM sorting domain-containing protein [Oscillatoria amoena NRMC-F 0135]MDL5052796.1 PEP-CTERM sorting domain-containing protein [Oscillatoria laete-virens NRMC-F 0139]
MKEKVNKLIQMTIVVVGILLLNNQVFSEIIIEDGFSGTGNLNGSTPDTVNLPGGTWTLKTVAGAGIFGNPQRGVMDGSYTTTSFGADISQALSVNTAQTILTLESEFKLNTVSGTGTHWGMGFGFFANTNNAGNSFVDFYGLILDSGGNLKVWTNGGLFTAPAASVNITNLISFSTSDYNTVRYTVDTTSGAISDIYINNALVSGLNDSYAGFIGNTSFAGIMTSASFGGDTSYFNSFSVSAIPEPSTYLMLFAGLVMTFFGLRLHKKNKKSAFATI